MSVKWFALRSAGLFAMFLAVLVSCLIILLLSVVSIAVEVFYLIKAITSGKEMGQTSASVPVAS